MRAFFISDCENRCCQHSHRATRETPSIVIVFQPVSSQMAQVTRHGNSDRALTNTSARTEFVRSDDRTSRRVVPNVWIVRKVVWHVRCPRSTHMFQQMRASHLAFATPAAVVELPLTQLFVFRFGLSASASTVSAGGGECRTRSVGADFTSAVPRRCSQSSMPRAISRFT